LSTSRRWWERNERAPEPSIYDLRLESRRPRLKPKLLKSEDKKRLRDAGGRKNQRDRRTSTEENERRR
jgi:hypothetical protein